MQQQWDGFRSAEPDGPPPVTSADGDQPGPSDAGGPDLTDLTAFEGDRPAMPSATAISWTGEDGQAKSGTVTSVRFGGSSPTAVVDGQEVPFGFLTEVSTPTE